MKEKKKKNNQQKKQTGGRNETTTERNGALMKLNQSWQFLTRRVCVLITSKRLALLERKQIRPFWKNWLRVRRRLSAVGAPDVWPIRTHPGVTKDLNVYTRGLQPFLAQGPLDERKKEQGYKPGL